MKTILMALIAAVSVQISASHPSVRRLDGTQIATDEIDATVHRLMNAAHVTGVGIAIFNSRRPVYIKAYGFRDTERQLPLTTSTVMTAASFTKVSFAYMIMQLVDDGVIQLDTPIQRYLPRPLPEYAGYESLAGDRRYERLTARMLLDHTSGFANLRVQEPGRKTQIHFEPGTRYTYSGQGLQLLQLVVETVTRRPVEDLMRERVFGPFGMSRTSMVWQARFETDYANGYDEDERSLGPERRPLANVAGSMQTTIGDFTRFMQAVVSGQRVRAPTHHMMLSPLIRIIWKHQFPTLATDTTDENDAIHLSYGLGWGLYATPRGQAFFKEGHDEGWRHYTVMFPAQGLGIVIMTNSSNGESIYKELLETVQKNAFTPIDWEGFIPYDQVPPSTTPTPKTH
jgi:CubicO group peptidase (beta-lactamase class C family)